jgi:Cu+-exporting ATPase
VSGVAKVEVNLKAKTLTVRHKPQASVSPLALWEAVVKANDKPVKIESPSGTFTTKPRS